MNVPFCDSDERRDDVTFTINFRPSWSDSGKLAASCFQGDTHHYEQVAIYCGSVWGYSPLIAAAQATITATTSLIVQLSSRTPPSVALTTTTTTTTEQTNAENVNSKQSDSLNVALAIGISVGLLLIITAVSIAACVYLKRRKLPPDVNDFQAASTDDTRYVTTAQMEALNVHAPISSVQQSTEQDSFQTNTDEYAIINKRTCNTTPYVDVIPGSSQVCAGSDANMNQSGSVMANKPNRDKSLAADSETVNAEYMNCGASSHDDKPGMTRENVMQDSDDDEYTRFEDNDFYRSGGIEMKNFRNPDQDDISRSTNEANTYPHEASETENMYVNSIGEQNTCFVDNDLYASN